MYPHSAMVGGGTRDYYPNDIARDMRCAVRAGRRIGLLAAVASILSRRRKAPRPVADGGRSAIPSPFHPSVMSKLELRDTEERERAEAEHVA